MSTKLIHQTAIVAPEAKIGENVEIGPYSIIGPDVEIGDDTIIQSHVIVEGIVTIGKSNKIGHFSSIGCPPQDYSYKNDPTRVEIGDGNTLREYVSIHRGTMKENGITKIGNNNFLMSYVHFGHDTELGNNCTIVNSVNVAGHVKIGDRVIVSGATNISQFVKLGRGSYIGGGSGIDKDIPPFCTAIGNRIRLKGINIIGMRRMNYSRQVISEVIDFLRTIESSAVSPKHFCDNEDLMKDYTNNEAVAEIAEHIQNSKVGIAPFLS